MNVIKTKLKDCVIIEPKVFGDERGFFWKHFKQIDMQILRVLLALCSG